MKKITLIVAFLLIGGIILAENINVTMQTNRGEIKLELWPEIAPKTVDNFVGLASGSKEYTDPNTGEQTTGNFYDGLIFHRVIKDFMIQGGCPQGTGTGGPGYKFEDETYGAGEPLQGEIKSDPEAMQIFSEVIIPYLQAGNKDAELEAIVDQCVKDQNGTAIKEHPVEYYLQKTGRTEPITSKGNLLASVDYGTICMANSGPNTNGSQFFIVTKKDGASWLDGKHTVFGKVSAGMDVVHEIENVETDGSDKPKDPVIIEKVLIEK
ncbi:MAG: peptidylprolyl isomerase [Candidatus Cloacimonadales bacterium]